MAGARVFRVEFRIAVARRILNGESVSALSNELKIKRAVLYRWRDAYRKHGEAGLNRPKGRPPGGTTRGISLLVPNLAVMCAGLLVAQGIHVLIGRDILSRCLLSYSGLTGFRGTSL
jgi:hypothetical protein